MRLFKRTELDNRDFSLMTLPELTQAIRDEGLIEKDNVILKESVDALSKIESIKDYYYLDPGIRVVFDVLERSKSWKTFTGECIRTEPKRRISEYNSRLKKKND